MYSGLSHVYRIKLEHCGHTTAAIWGSSPTPVL